MSVSRKRTRVIISDDEDDIEFLPGPSLIRAERTTSKVTKTITTITKAPVKKRGKTESRIPAEPDIEDCRPHSKGYHSTERVRARVENLLEWFEIVREQRGMPWRKKYDPGLTMAEKGQRAYEVWVSEVMLQQTQVNTVIPYWNKWLEKWPTIADLAKADIEEVNAAWRGLGYYRRAKSLLLGAQKVMGDPNYEGRLPDTVTQMEKDIPGVGRYTAGAICSIAYGEKSPIVDGNINRLFARLLGLHLPSDSPLLIKELWHAAQSLIAESEALEKEGIVGDWNQALMELGSQICKPTGTDCKSCPLREACNAYTELSVLPKPPKSDSCTVCHPFPSTSLGKPQDTIPSVTVYPMKKADKKGPRAESTAVAVVQWLPYDGDVSRARWLLVQRPETGLLAGLYEPTSVFLADKAVKPLERLNMLREYLTTLMEEDQVNKARIPKTHLGLSTTSGYLSDYLHVFSHIKMVYHIHLLTIKAENQSTDVPPSLKTPLIGKWMTMEETAKANVGTGVKRIWSLVYGKKSVFEVQDRANAAEEAVLKLNKTQKVKLNS